MSTAARNLELTLTSLEGPDSLSLLRVFLEFALVAAKERLGHMGQAARIRHHDIRLIRDVLHID
jgi:hypothetical protein